MTNSSNAEHWKKLGKHSSTFYFKQFKVEDGQSTMKVGTDAVLLGVVADLEKVENILEIGTGCGVIAFILAQRSKARIDAIEIDAESVVQARDNVKDNRWKDRINIIHSSLQDFAKQPGKKYDLIISNPPYFSGSLKSSDKKRNISRHDESLSFEELIDGSLKLMLPAANLWIILPVNESRIFMEKAGNSGLFVHYHLKIAHKSGGEYQRVIIQFRKTSSDKINEQTIAIKNEDDSFTEAYINLTRDFYIDF
jgi:tRNA1Val (adenine37-N6)-methyltransferase